MRILHTSDWHLGRTFHGRVLDDAHAAFADHLVELVTTESVDAVLVAGDVYDRAIPPKQGSMQGIKSYFMKYPQAIPQYLFQNDRHIFFKLTGDLPRGSSGSEVVAHRTIAMGKQVYPAGSPRPRRGTIYRLG